MWQKSQFEKGWKPISKSVHCYDKRDVFALSSIHGTGDTEVHRQGDVEPVSKPMIIFNIISLWAMLIIIIDYSEKQLFAEVFQKSCF